MSVSTKEFKEQLRRNRDYCFCGEKLKVGRDGIPYCPICNAIHHLDLCLLYTSPSPRDRTRSRMPSSA